jgi:predicted MFS family arabinose efflux permease
MLASDLLARGRAGADGGLVVLTDAPVGVVYVLAGCVAVVNTAFTPAQSALLPSLARTTPRSSTAANVSSSTIESLGFCVGPALGGVLLTVSSVWVVFMSPRRSSSGRR